MFRQLRGIVAFGGLTLNTLFWFIPLFILALFKLLLPIGPVRRVLTALLMRIGENWISVNTLILRPVGSAGWRLAGDTDLRRDGWYLVLSNHRSWVDILVLQAAFNRRIPFLKFFIKQQLIWFPFLGIAWWALDMPFMKRYSSAYLAKHPDKRGRDLEATRKACEKFRTIPTSVINFVEGTRFSEEKRDRRKSPYRNLLVPRAGGVAVAIDSMGQLFDAVLDVTLAYRGGAPNFWGMCCGDRVDVLVHVRRRALSAELLNGDYAESREDRAKMRRWLGEVWADKDRLLDSSNGEHSQNSRPLS